ncbi:MAG: hypothetical protein RBU29_03640, partial [bacterium]|nr:hypothetical protein [bacterium]
LDRADVFQLAPKTKDDKPHPPNPLQGRLLFGSDITYPVLQRCFNAGFVVKKTSITEEFPYADFQTYYQNQAIPLFLKEGDKRWRVFAADVELQPKAGDTLISLVPALRQNGG